MSNTNSPNLRGPIILSILAALLTIGLKGSAYYITGSVSLFSDALESAVNLLAALTAFFSLWYSSRPVDPTHAYGHEKIEFFSSGLEGVLIGLAGCGTIWYAVLRLITPAPLYSLELGSLLALIASVINFVVARILLTVGRRHRSVVLEADGQHLMSDVLTSVGVVAGLALVWLTDIKALDPLLAIAVGLHILVTGVKLIRRSFDGLMDHALTDDDQQQLRAAIQEALPVGTTYHLLRTRLAGRRKLADFHFLVPGNMTVHEGHEIAHQIEAALHERISDLEVTIHVEPIEDLTSWEVEMLHRLGESTQPKEASHG